MPSALGAISAGSGLLSANKASKAQKKADANLAKQKAISLEEIKLARDQWEDFKTYIKPLVMENMQDDKTYRKEDRDFYTQYFRPEEIGLVEEATTDNRSNYMTGLAAERVDRDFDKARDAADQNLMKAQVDPSSGRSLETQHALDYDQGNQRALAIDQERLGERDRQFKRQATVSGIGDRLRRPPINANSPVNPGQISSLYNKAGQQYGQNAAYQQNIANSYANSAGNAARAGMNLFLKGYSGSGSGAGMGGTNFNDGGMVDAAQAPTAPQSQNPNIEMQDGQFVIPADVVKALGIEYFDKMVEKYELGET